MGDVVYGRFAGQLEVDGAHAREAAPATHQPQLGAQQLTQHPLQSLEHDFASRVRVLGELASHLADPGTDPAVAGPLFTELVALQAAGNKIASELASARNDDAAFLRVQGELKTWIESVDALERKALEQTDSEIITTTGEEPNKPAVVPRKFPVVWVGLGMLALGGITWFAVARSGKKTKRSKAPEEKPFKKVKLRRALPAR